MIPEDLNNNEHQDISPTEFINKASAERARRKIEQELLEKQQQIIQEKINRKIRENIKEEKEKKKIKTIQDALKKGEKIRWEIVNNNLKGFVKNKLTFEIKKGMTLYNLYVKDSGFLKEGCKSGYISCSTDINKVKSKAEGLLV